MDVLFDALGGGTVAANDLDAVTILESEFDEASGFAVVHVRVVHDHGPTFFDVLLRFGVALVGNLFEALGVEAITTFVVDHVIVVRDNLRSDTQSEDPRDLALPCTGNTLHDDHLSLPHKRGVTEHAFMHFLDTRSLLEDDVMHVVLDHLIEDVNEVRFLIHSLFGFVIAADVEIDGFETRLDVRDRNAHFMYL